LTEFIFFFLKFINNKVPNCAKCLLPLGDAYVLVNLIIKKSN